MIRVSMYEYVYYPEKMWMVPSWLMSRSLSLIFFNAAWVGSWSPSTSSISILSSFSCRSCHIHISRFLTSTWVCLGLDDLSNHHSTPKHRHDGALLPRTSIGSCLCFNGEAVAILMIGHKAENIHGIFTVWFSFDHLGKRRHVTCEGNSVAGCRQNEDRCHLPNLTYVASVYIRVHLN